VAFNQRRVILNYISFIIMAELIGLKVSQPAGRAHPQ
jgi:hypothetical protein